MMRARLPGFVELLLELVGLPVLVLGFYRQLTSGDWDVVSVLLVGIGGYCVARCWCFIKTSFTVQAWMTADNR